jgi:hypothetical protein
MGRAVRLEKKHCGRLLGAKVEGGKRVHGRTSGLRLEPAPIVLSSSQPWRRMGVMDHVLLLTPLSHHQDLSAVFASRIAHH